MSDYLKFTSIIHSEDPYRSHRKGDKRKNDLPLTLQTSTSSVESSPPPSLQPPVVVSLLYLPQVQSSGLVVPLGAVENGLIESHLYLRLVFCEPTDNLIDLGIGLIMSMKGFQDGTRE